jgi:hypothetical protein
VGTFADVADEQWQAVFETELLRRLQERRHLTGARRLRKKEKEEEGMTTIA